MNSIFSSISEEEKSETPRLIELAVRVARPGRFSGEELSPANTMILRLMIGTLFCGITQRVRPL